VIQIKEQKISAIREGTVIDHIPVKNVFKIAEILDLKEHGNIVSVATNLQSKKIGTKGIIKVGGRSLSQEEVNKIALLAPNATVSIIKDYNVIKKFSLELPKEVYNIIQCNNPKCITNMENISTRFSVLKDDNISARCGYCERIMQEKEIQIR